MCMHAFACACMQMRMRPTNADPDRAPHLQHQPPVVERLRVARGDLQGGGVLLGRQVQAAGRLGRCRRLQRARQVRQRDAPVVQGLVAAGLEGERGLVALAGLAQEGDLVGGGGREAA